MANRPDPKIHIFADEAPLCKCGCGNPTNRIKAKGNWWFAYLSGHNGRLKEARSDDDEYTDEELIDEFKNLTWWGIQRWKGSVLNSDPTFDLKDLYQEAITELCRSRSLFNGVKDRDERGKIALNAVKRGLQALTRHSERYRANYQGYQWLPEPHHMNPNAIYSTFGEMMVDTHDELPLIELDLLAQEELAPQQLRVYEYLREGFTVNEIAEKMQLTPATISGYKSVIGYKFKKHISR